MANVTVIPARRRRVQAGAVQEKPKIKVAAYCRVSTDSDEQATSYEMQVEHYTDYITKNPKWELVDIYAYYTQQDHVKYTELKDKCKSLLEEIMQ